MDSTYCNWNNIGYKGLDGKISKNASLILILSGALYHAHIWLDHTFNK